MFHKKHVHTLATFTLGAGERVTLVNGIPEGYGELVRIGHEVTMTEVRMSMNAYSTTVNQGNGLMRLMLVYDRQVNGVTPSMYSGSAGVLEIAIIGISPINDTQDQRFQVLADRNYKMNGAYNQGGGGETQVTDIWQIPLCHNVTFSGSGATVSNIKTGGLFLMAFSTVTTKMDASITVHFKDC